MPRRGPVLVSIKHMGLLLIPMKNRAHEHMVCFFAWHCIPTAILATNNSCYENLKLKSVGRFPRLRLTFYMQPGREPQYSSSRAIKKARVGCTVGQKKLCVIAKHHRAQSPRSGVWEPKLLSSQLNMSYVLLGTLNSMLNGTGLFVYSGPDWPCTWFGISCVRRVDIRIEARPRAKHNLQLLIINYWSLISHNNE